jgi:hypothetical protein
MSRTTTWVLGMALATGLPAAAQQKSGHTMDQTAALQAAQEQKAAEQRQQERAPREEATALVDGKKVRVEYGRPALKGRTVDQLLSQLGPDRVWRAGENQVTTLTTAGDVTIGGTRVPAGRYSLYLLHPQGGDWHLLLNSDPGIALRKIYAAAPPEVADAPWPRLDGYDKIAASEVARIPLRRGTVAEPAERFLIGLAPAKGGVSSITFTWGDQSWTAELKPAR